MTDLTTLLRAVAGNPDDDLARLALADHLEESGDPRCLWARSPDLWRWSRPDLGDPLPRMLAALSASESADAVVRGCARLGPACLDALLARSGDMVNTTQQETLARALAEVCPTDRLPEIGRLLRERKGSARSVVLSAIEIMGRRALVLLSDVLSLYEPAVGGGLWQAASNVLRAMQPVPDEAYATIERLLAGCGDSFDEENRRDALEYAAASCRGEPVTTTNERYARSLFGDPEEPPRRRELVAFAETADASPEAEARLVDMLRDEDVFVRTAAASMLAARPAISAQTAATLAAMPAEPGAPYGPFPRTALGPHLARHPDVADVLRGLLRTAPSHAAAATLDLIRENASAVPSLLPDVLAVVDADYPGIYATTADVVAAFGEPGVRAILARLAAAPVVVRRWMLPLQAARSLPAEALPLLDAAGRSDDALVRAVAVSLLPRVATADDVRPRLLAALGDPFWPVRWAAVTSLAVGPWSAAVAAALHRCFLTDDETRIRVAAFLALTDADNGEARTPDLLRAALADGDATMRADALRVCGRKNLRAFRAEVEARREDASAVVRQEAERLLASWGDLS